MRTFALTILATAALVWPSPQSDPQQLQWHIPATPVPPTSVLCCCSTGHGSTCCGEMPVCMGSIIIGCMCR